MGTGFSLQPAELGYGSLESFLPSGTPDLSALAPQTMLSFTCDSDHRVTHSLWKLLFLTPSLTGGHCLFPSQGDSCLYSFPSVYTLKCDYLSVLPKHQR